MQYLWVPCMQHIAVIKQCLADQLQLASPVIDLAGMIAAPVSLSTQITCGVMRSPNTSAANRFHSKR